MALRGRALRRARRGTRVRSALLAAVVLVAAHGARAQDPSEAAGTAPGPDQRAVTGPGEAPASPGAQTAAPPAEAPASPAPGAVPSGGGVSWARAPVRYDGLVGVIFTDTMPSGSPSTYNTLLYSRINGNTYLKAPWFATLEGGVGLNTSVQKSATGGGNSVSATGDLGFTLFPISRFPFHAFAGVTDSRINQDLIGTTPYTSTTAGMTQSYVAVGGRTNYSGGVTYNRLNGDRFGSDTQLSINANVTSTVVDEHQMSLAATAVSDDRKAGSEQSRTYNVTAKDEWHDSDGISLLTLASFNRTEFRLADSDSTSSFSQITSSGSWLPLEDVPLLVSGGLYLSTANTQTNAARVSSNVDNKNVGGSVGGNYQFNKNLRLNANASGSINQMPGTERRSSRIGGTASYWSDPVRFGSFSYNSGLSAGGAVRTDSYSGNTPLQVGTTAGTQTQTTESASHSLSRNTALDDTTRLTVRLTQGLAATQGSTATQGSVAQGESLQHSANATWTRSGETRQLFAGLTVTDMRSKLSTIDLVNAQLSANGDLSRYSTLSAALTLQASRQSLSGASADPQSQSGTTSKNACADVTYTHFRAFGVPRLRFSSILRADTFTRDARFNGTVGAPAEDVRMSWENRLDYTVGLLTVQLLGRVVQSAGKTNGLIFVSAIRRFNGIY